MNRPRMAARLLIAGSLLTASTLWGAAPASAHAALQSSTPAEGKTLTTLPDSVSVTLNEPVAEPAALALTGPDGKRANAQSIDVKNRTASSRVTVDNPQNGEYTLAYRVVSTDSHVVTGSITFTLEAPPAPVESETPEAAAPATPDTELASSPEESGSPGFTTILTVLGFFVVAMAGLIWMVRAGLRERDREDV